MVWDAIKVRLHVSQWQDQCWRGTSKKHQLVTTHCPSHTMTTIIAVLLHIMKAFHWRILSGTGIITLSEHATSVCRKDDNSWVDMPLMYLPTCSSFPKLLKASEKPGMLHLSSHLHPQLARVLTDLWTTNYIIQILGPTALHAPTSIPTLLSLSWCLMDELVTTTILKWLKPSLVHTSSQDTNCLMWVPTTLCKVTVKVGYLYWLE